MSRDSNISTQTPPKSGFLAQLNKKHIKALFCFIFHGLREHSSFFCPISLYIRGSGQIQIVNHAWLCDTIPDQYLCTKHHKGSNPERKNVFFWALPKLPLPNFDPNLFQKLDPKPFYQKSWPVDHSIFLTFVVQGIFPNNLATGFHGQKYVKTIFLCKRHK